jgi:excisionase family DNA binding protein
LATATVGTSEKLLLTVTEASMRLGLARSYMYGKLVLPGRIRSIKLGRARRIPLSELERFINEELAHQAGGTA